MEVWCQRYNGQTTVQMQPCPSYDRGPIVASRPVVVEEDWTVDREEAIHQASAVSEVLQLLLRQDPC